MPIWKKIQDIPFLQARPNALKRTFYPYWNRNQYPFYFEIGCHLLRIQNLKVIAQKRLILVPIFDYLLCPPEVERNQSQVA